MRKFIDKFHSVLETPIALFVISVIVIGTALIPPLNYGGMVCMAIGGFCLSSVMWMMLMKRQRQQFNAVINLFRQTWELDEWIAAGKNPPPPADELGITKH